MKLISKLKSGVGNVVYVSLFFLAFTEPSYALLSASSINVIHGTKPQLTNESTIASNLSFTLSSTTYKLSNNTYTSSVLFAATSKLSDFKINALTGSDFSMTDNYFDSEGDIILSNAQFTGKTPTYRWLDRNGAVIPTSSYSQTIGGCSTTLKAPLTLEITASVSVNSSYGIPTGSDPVIIKQSYKIQSPAQICYLRPNSLDWVGSDWNTGSTTPDKVTRGGGFNSATFSQNNGFFISSKFPTTGFIGAQFKLTMDRVSQTDYTYTMRTNSTAISVDTNGLVTFKSKPSGAVTIRAQDKTLASRYIDYSFTIANWVVPKPTKGTYAQISGACGSTANIPSPSVLTNSPQRTLPANITPNYYSRDVGTVFSEWGQTIKQKYTGSDWHSDWSNMPYFLPNTHSSGLRYSVSSLSGPVMAVGSADLGYMVCKG
ncbi:hypothetical protein [Zophobihabitans entericus]|uniref:Invasin domain-containing protein n=1 Tax=Zophobihabitans entericus TaxID=1635327 RepID=A0A6G9ICE0_9GAMM|nr:hypothetical protein [Zophobihabitans entericus]QIQ21898.1 hypothetical protein IPMB12_09530 [Zophobihabitans entericus]